MNRKRYIPGSAPDRLRLAPVNTAGLDPAGAAVRFPGPRIGKEFAGIELQRGITFAECPGGTRVNGGQLQSSR